MLRWKKRVRDDRESQFINRRQEVDLVYIYTIGPVASSVLHPLPLPLLLDIRK
jgi:hypothetical protein